MANTSYAPQTRALAARFSTAIVHMHRQLRRMDAGLDLPVAQASALALLAAAGPHTIGALANFELVAAPTMTRIVSALEAKGLIARSRSPGDGRVVQVEATAKGRRMVADAFSARVDSLAEKLEALTPEERARIEAALVVFERLGRAP